MLPAAVKTAKSEGTTTDHVNSPNFIRFSKANSTTLADCLAVQCPSSHHLRNFILIVTQLSWFQYLIHTPHNTSADKATQVQVMLANTNTSLTEYKTNTFDYFRLSGQFCKSYFNLRSVTQRYFLLTAAITDNLTSVHYLYLGILISIIVIALVYMLDNQA